MKKENRIYLLDTVVMTMVVAACVFWLTKSDFVRETPYLLGLFRGFVWPTIIINTIRWAIS